VRSRHAFFNESNLHADDEACVEFLHDRDFGFVHQILTFRRTYEGSMTSFSQRYNTYAYGLLLLLVRHGARYLTEHERQRRIREVLDDYYLALGRAVFHFRDREYWRFHRKMLVSLGLSLSPGRLAMATLSVAGDALLNPKQSIQRVLRVWSRRTDTAGVAHSKPSSLRTTA
jgi:hypothetical protein